MNATAIIINYHTSSFLPPLLGDLQDTEYIEKIIIIDNSNELHGNLWNGAFSKKVETIVNKKNIGFAAAVNQACRYVETDWFLLVNPDVRIDDKSILEMLQAARRYDSPILGPRFFWDDQKRFRLPPATGSCLWLEFAGRCAEGHVLDSELFSFYWTLRHDRFWQAKKPFNEPFLSGACLLILKSWVEQLEHDLFDERFFLYYEDTDLCSRAIMNGVYPLCIPDAEVVHYYNQTPTPDHIKQGLMMESSRSFLQKHYGETIYPDFPEKKGSGGKRTEDKGDFDDSPPVFPQIPLHGREISFEIAVNPHFVPFAQAALNRADFRIPMDIWKRLAPGTYYSRFRSGADIIKVWKWKKI